jgi:CHAT domain-containing protein
LILKSRIHLDLGESSSAEAQLNQVAEDLRDTNLLDRVDYLISTIHLGMARAELSYYRYERGMNSSDLQDALSWLENSRDAIRSLSERYLGDGSKRAVARASSAAIDSLVTVSLLLFRISADTAYIHKAFLAAEEKLGGVLTEVLEKTALRKMANVPSDLLLQEAELRGTVQRAVRVANVDSDSSRLEVVRLSNEYESLLRRMERKYPRHLDLERPPEPNQIQDIQRVLKDGEVVLEFAFLGGRFRAFIVSRREVALAEVDGSRHADSLAANLRAAISSQDYLAFVSASRNLYKALIEPVEEYIAGKHVIIVPDGVLHFVPFEVLLTEDVPDGGDARSYRTLPYLIRKNPISYSYSATLIHQLRTQNRIEPEMLFFGVAPVFQKALPDAAAGSSVMRQNIDSTAIKLRNMYLPASLDEVSRIRRLFRRTVPVWKRYFADKSSVLLHAHATESAVKSADLSRYKYVHLASHAFANESNPDLSGIVLSAEAVPDERTGANASQDAEDGVLHLNEVYNLKINADLVVLSACETGLGKLATGEGIIGLTRGFLYSGARNVMVSLWKADDATTRDLMVSFYDSLLKGASKAEALQSAKLALISTNPVHARPFFWAQFVIIGE